MTNKEKGKVYYVGGINGAGKSTLLGELKQYPSEFEVMSASARFMQHLGLKPGDYDGLRAIPEDVAKKERDKLWSEVITGWDNKDLALVLDMHYLNLKWGKTIDVTGDWIKDVTALFLITADTDTLLARINSDKDRDRALFVKGTSYDIQKNILDEYVELTKQRVKSLAKQHNLPYFILENKDGKLQETVDKFLEIHRALK